MIAFIWAQDQKRQIGHQGRLPWHLPADLAYFKKKTSGHPMVMGRKTFASFPGFLPGREHIVLTRDKDFRAKYPADAPLTVYHSLPELREWLLAQSELVFVIGGASLFESLKDDVSRLYLTEIEETFEGDTVMPKLDLTKFTLLEKKVGQIDAKNRYPHTFYVYERK